MKKLILVKIGGSIITQKDSNLPKPRLSIIKRLAQDIKTITSSQKYSLILVHGAGSFAHPIVKKFQIQSGMFNASQKIGFSLAILACMN